LKRLLRQRGFKCINIGEWSPEMNTSELEHLRNFAAAFRSQGGLGTLYIKLDGNTGAWKKGKDPFDVTGRRLIADTHDAMHGWRTFEDKRPVWCIGRVADGWKPPPAESFDENWKQVVLLPLYDAQTHEPYLFTSQNKGGRDAIANLVDTMFDVYSAYPQDVGKPPICELATDSYVNTHRKQIFVPIFETVGWAERPAEVRRIKPPPATMLAIEGKSPDDEIPF
jgi:hypothetical protein